MQMFFRPLISVIVPVYNVEKYLPQCLDSLIKQTFLPFEIICVNDGSAVTKFSAVTPQKTGAFALFVRTTAAFPPPAMPD